MSRCALRLLSRFHLPNSFAKPPSRFSVCDCSDSGSSNANRPGPFVFECSLCRPYGPSSILPSCALPGLFHSPNSFAKPHPRSSVSALHRWFSKLHSLPPLTPSVTVAALHGLAAARNRSGAAAGTRNDGSTWTHRDCVFDQPPWRRLDSPPPGLAAEAASAPVYSH